MSQYLKQSLIGGRYMGPILGNNLVNGWVHVNLTSGTVLPKNTPPHGLGYTWSSSQMTYLVVQ